jgi:hypothetical protein
MARELITDIQSVLFVHLRVSEIFAVMVGVFSNTAVVRQEERCENVS